MSRPIRILYSSGPGDVIGTYHHWEAGREDPSEVSATYSSQFFSLCRELGAQAKVLSQRPDGRRMAQGNVVIVEQMIPFQKSGRALLFHLGQLYGAIHLAKEAIRFQADVALVAEGTHWFGLSLLSAFGIRVIPDIQCTLWPMGRPPNALMKRAILAINGWFWRRLPSATLCISPECERQVLQISKGRARNLIATRPTYSPRLFAGVSPPNVEGRPFMLLYAGRLERNKGVFDLIKVMRELEALRPGTFQCIICGDGSARDELEKAVKESGLCDAIHLMGQLDRERMMQELSRSHALIVPTTYSFIEGLNRVAIEGALAGRPVIVTSTCPAAQIIQNAAIIVEPGDITAMRDAALQLESDAAFRADKLAAQDGILSEFFGCEKSWGAGLKRALQLAASEGVSLPDPETVSDQPTVDHLLVLPVPFRLIEGRLCVESQAYLGLQRWLEQFSSMIVAAPLIPEHMATQRTNMTWRAVTDLENRIRFIPLPWAYNPLSFLRHLRKTRELLRACIRRSLTLQFAISGLWGDWASVGAEEAAAMGRQFAIHVDRVEHNVVLTESTGESPLKRARLCVDAVGMKIWHKRLMGMAKLALCHGADCFEYYRQRTKNPVLVHNVHDFDACDEAPKGKLPDYASRTLRICYAGRAEPMKAPLDWLRALSCAKAQGARFHATWLGDGSLLVAMRDLVAELQLANEVALPGFSHDRSVVLKTIRNSDVMLFTHITMESPRCIIEALRLGTPIIGYESAYAKDIISAHGGGILTPRGDYQRLGMTLARLAANPAGLALLAQKAHCDGLGFTSKRVFAHRGDEIKRHVRSPSVEMLQLA